MAGRRAKRIEIWGSGLSIQCVQGTFDTEAKPQGFLLHIVVDATTDNYSMCSIVHHIYIWHYVHKVAQQCLGMCHVFRSNSLPTVT